MTFIAKDNNFFKSYSYCLYSDASLLENEKQKMKLPLPKIFGKVQENLKFDHPKLISILFRLYCDTSLLENEKQKMKLPLPNIFSKVQENLKFDPPKLISRDTSSCLRDDEFGRQAVAGINPLSIERLTVFPPVSKLDPSMAHKSQHSRRNI
ncbi:hypothetical protein ACFX2K_037024 [Malus domestica]